jgi:hypothetical protein
MVFNGMLDIDYCLAIQKLIDLNFDPFPNTPRPDSLFVTCLDFNLEIKRKTQINKLSI